MKRQIIEKFTEIQQWLTKIWDPTLRKREWSMKMELTLTRETKVRLVGLVFQKMTVKNENRKHNLYYLIFCIRLEPNQVKQAASTNIQEK